jgi:membrane associated rhomboid family serine protease
MQFRQPNYTSFGFRRGLTPGIKWLLIANVAVFLLQQIAGGQIDRYFGLSSRSILNDFFIWQIVTYMFLHAGFLHILFNMFMLWIFGIDLERQWGTKEFLKFYFITGIGAGIVTFLVNIANNSITIGASGAIFGVMMAYGMLYPNRLLYIWFLFPVKAKYLVFVMFALGIAFSWGSTGPGIAHFAHLGGALIAFLYLKQDWRLGTIFAPFKRLRFKRKAKVKFRENRKAAELMAEVDRILDRINELGGYENLPERDKKILDKASKELSNKRE